LGEPSAKFAVANLAVGKVHVNTPPLNFYVFGKTCRAGGFPQFFKAAYTMNKSIVCITFMVLPLFAYGQDCCGPGGGGGTSTFAAVAGNEDQNYRMRSARHYSNSARHPGLTAGLETGGINDKSQANISPRLEYSGSWEAGFLGSFDVYGGAFYSVFFDKPHSHQIDVAENIAWRLAPDKNSRLVFRVDNEDLAVFFPDTVIFAYATLDPSVSYSRAFGFGDLSLSLGFPVLIKPENGLNTYFTAGYEHPIGLGISICPRFLLIPDTVYGGITFTLSFAWDTFFVKAAFVVNEDCSACDIRPYAEFTLGRLIFWAGAEFGGLGENDVSINPFVGTGYHF
jgi:hypothetical protein